MPNAEALTTRSFDAPVKIDEESFPDATFRDYVAQNIDTNKDGFLTPRECDAVTSMGSVDEGTWKVEEPGLRYAGVSDIKGIELFPNLTTVNLSNNALGSVDLSSNTKLTQLDVRGCNQGTNENFKLTLPETESIITLIVESNARVDDNLDNVKVIKVD